MKEANMQKFFADYLQEHLPESNEVYELKMTSGNSIRFDAVKEHQIENLQKAEQGTFYYRIIDQPWIAERKWAFQLKKPFDCFCIAKSKAYIVVWFYVPRTPKKFIKIKIHDFLQMKKYSERKSFTEDMAIDFCEEVLEI